MKAGSWQGVLASLVLALAGQALVLFAGQAVAGGLVILSGVALLAWELARKDPMPPEATQGLSRNRTAVLLLGILLVAFLFRRFEMQSIPWGLNNDEGIEGLIACRFLAGERITPFSNIGVSRETLYHLMLMPLFYFAGPGIASLRALSLLCGMGAVILIYFLGQELFSKRAGVFAAFLLAVSPWHVLYSRTGLRNILLPVLLLGSLWAFTRALRLRRPSLFILTGILLAAGMYSYTSFRVVPPALLLWALVRRRFLGAAPLTWKETGLTCGTFLTLMVPQFLIMLSDPLGFLARGGYVLAQTPDASIPGNVLFSFVMPVYYPARFGVMQSRWFFSDGVSLVYAAVGRTPESLVSAALMALGVVLAGARFIRKRAEAEGLVLFLFGLTVLTVGLAGPSLTRLIGNLPLLCLLAGLFLEEVWRRLLAPSPRWLGVSVLAALLAGAAAMGFEQYFLRAGSSPKAMFYFAAPQTLMGLYAASRAPDHPVTVFYTEEPETLQFLTFARRQLVSLQSDPSKIDWNRIRGAEGRQEFVLENQRRFLPVFSQIAKQFPWADATMLRDAQRNPELPVAYVLDVVPQRRDQVPSSPP
ncbi:MAG: glycosyltransferase family 39 protein [Acidobacteria bacterium]|nr:glycosyltransferase family 39 protein [Acidobacteriota bacterium]